jgi:DNA-binding Lrp family transcriptional regulator
MKEIDVRRAIHKLDLKPNTKLTLLGILCFVKWDSFTGQVSAKDISKEMNINERSVKRALKELIDLGLLTRSAQRRNETQHHRAMTKVNVELITGTVTTRPPSVIKTPPSDIVTPPSGNMTLPPSDIVTPPSGNTTLPPSGNMTLPPSDIVTPNTTKDNNKGYTTEVSTEESNEEQVRLERLLSYGVTPENAEIAITEYMDEESSDRLTAVIALERMAKINYDAKKRNERMRRFR